MTRLLTALPNNYVDGSIASLFNLSLTYENCITSASCSTTLSEEGNCSIEYGEDPGYENLGGPVSGHLNSLFSLPLMESSTLYYIQITLLLNSRSFVLRRNFSTGSGDKQYLCRAALT